MTETNERPFARSLKRSIRRSTLRRAACRRFAARAGAVALHRHSEFNGDRREIAFVVGDGIDIGVAILLRAGWVVAPAPTEVDRKDIEQFDRELLDLIRSTRAGSADSSELSAGTIPVTRLSEQGVGSVFGVIYPPQVALVRFDRTTERPYAVDGGMRGASMITAALGPTIVSAKVIAGTLPRLHRRPAAESRRTDKGKPVKREELMQTILQRLTTIAPDADTASIEPTKLLREQVDLDAADRLNVLVALNAKPGIDIPDADVGKLTTLDRRVDYCGRRL